MGEGGEDFAGGVVSKVVERGAVERGAESTGKGSFVGASWNVKR